MIRATVRRSTRIRRCERCEGRIFRCDQYLESVASPGHEDIDNRGWIRMAECKPCAIRCDRWPAAADLPGGQP